MLNFQPEAQASRYLDDPSLADAVSLHTTPGDRDDDAPDGFDGPPPYTDDEELEPNGAGPTSQRPQDVKILIIRDGVQIAMDSRFDKDPVYAEEKVRSWAQIPPVPMIHIVGTHTQTVRKNNKKERETIVDFDIKLNMGIIPEGASFAEPQLMELRTVANSEKTYRGGIIKKQAKSQGPDLEVGDVRPGLDEWCHRFCASHAKLKIFRLSRVVTGLDEDVLRNRLEILIRATNYKGHIKITFPVEDRAVDVYSSHPFNRWRLTTWIRFLFYLSMLWIVTWPYLFFATKRYAVVRAEWPFSKVDANGRKHWTTFSEQQWFEQWSQLIRKCVLEGKQGILTHIDLAHARAEPQEFRSGNQHVDTAVRFLTAGLQAVNDVNRQLGWGGDC